MPKEHKADRSLTVGLTFFIRPGNHSIWENGASQQCVFLLDLLKRCPSVGRVIAINGGDGDAPSAGMMLAGLNIEFKRIEEVIDDLDVLIESAAQVSAENVAKVQARGGKAVTYKFGNAFVIDVERIIHEKSSGSIFNGSKFDRVWTNAQHAPTCAGYWETCYRCPVEVLPHLWEPVFVDKTIVEMGTEAHFGYIAGSTKKRVSVFEPNINVVKTCVIPMLVCEEAYRAAPELLDSVYITNSNHITKHLSFQHFAKNLDIVKTQHADGKGLCSFEARYNMPMFLAKYTDIVVSHQWENGLNFAYYDALYGGYPLVHNSDLLPDGVGYKYNGFDTKQGGQVLLDVMRNHDANYEGYLYRSSEYLDTLRVSYPRNIELYDTALRSLFD